MHEDGNPPGLCRSDLNMLDDVAAGLWSRRGRFRHRSARASQFRGLCLQHGRMGQRRAFGGGRRGHRRRGRQGSRCCAPTLMTRGPARAPGAWCRAQAWSRLARWCRSAPVRSWRMTRLPRCSRLTRLQLPTVLWDSSRSGVIVGERARICSPRVPISRRERAGRPRIQHVRARRGRFRACPAACRPGARDDGARPGAGRAEPRPEPAVADSAAPDSTAGARAPSPRALMGLASPAAGAGRACRGHAGRERSPGGRQPLVHGLVARLVRAWRRGRTAQRLPRRGEPATDLRVGGV